MGKVGRHWRLIKSEIVFDKISPKLLPDGRVRGQYNLELEPQDTSMNALLPVSTKSYVIYFKATELTTAGQIIECVTVTPDVIENTCNMAGGTLNEKGDCDTRQQACEAEQGQWNGTSCDLSMPACVAMGGNYSGNPGEDNLCNLCGPLGLGFYDYDLGRCQNLPL